MPELRTHLLFPGVAVNWRDLIFFVPFAVLTNTSVPLTFDPVLLYFSTRHGSNPFALALIGSICAGVAAVADITFLSWLHRKRTDHWPAWMPYWRGRRFYFFTFLAACLPIPFWIVRLAVLRHPPETIFYGLAVSLGRLPRYLLTVALWPRLGLPTGSAGILLSIALSVPLVRAYWFSVRKLPAP
jgi:hypothetical protein